MDALNQTPPGEAVSKNGIKGVTPRLSICIPAYQENASALLKSLYRQHGAELCELIVYDDGSDDAYITADIARWIYKYPGPARLVTSLTNHGRAFARNRLIAHAESDWLLLLDADMQPDSKSFLKNYLAEIDAGDGKPRLIAGGFSLNHIRPTRIQALHAAQARRSECLKAVDRNKAPGRYVFTSNILVHADILASVPFDEGFIGWGWEDVDWGLSVAEAWPVLHIDNTATHLGLDDADTLLKKYATSGTNFARLALRHPKAVDDMPLMRAAQKLRSLPATGFIRNIAKALARNRLGLVPIPIRLFALKLYRAATYARHLS